MGVEPGKFGCLHVRGLPPSVSEAGELAGWFDGVTWDAEAVACEFEEGAVAVVQGGQFDLGRLKFAGYDECVALEHGKRRAAHQRDGRCRIFCVSWHVYLLVVSRIAWRFCRSQGTRIFFRGRRLMVREPSNFPEWGGRIV
jgi:hypothetical protein